MSIPHELHGQLIAFLTSIPDINILEKQRSLIELAHLDPQLNHMLTPNTQPSIFFPLILSTMEQYGKLEDGRYPILAVLEAAKSLVGPAGKEESERLIKALKGEDMRNQGDGQKQALSSKNNTITGGPTVNITFGNGANVKGFTIGNDNQTAIDVDAEGDFVQNKGGNVEINKTVAGPSVESKEDMLKVLTQIQELIAGLDIESRRTKKAMGDAVEEAVLEIEEPANGKEPDKQTISDHLQKAVETLKAAGATAAQAVAFGQLVGQAATWLGPHADGLLKLLGL